MLGEVGEDVVDSFSASGLSNNAGKELDIVNTGVPACGFFFDFARFHIESGIEGQRAVPVVFQTMTLGPAGRSGKTGTCRSSAYRRHKTRPDAFVGHAAHALTLVGAALDWLPLCRGCKQTVLL